MKEPWPMRPHHGLCLNFFTGKGYSDAFVKNMTAVSMELKMNPGGKIVLHSGMDLLCRSCPHSINEICETEQKVARYDQKCLAFSGLHDGQILSWREFQQRVVEKIILPGLHTGICADCCWISVCQHCIVEKSVQSVENL